VAVDTGDGRGGPPRHPRGHWRRERRAAVTARGRGKCSGEKRRMGGGGRKRLG
jgi:hypothetical protein